MTREQARLARREAVAKRRLDEALCAADFLYHGDTRGPHRDRCVRPAGLVCSREYDPGPVPEDRKLYEGTMLGALWNLNNTHAWQLAGWTLSRKENA